MRLPSTLRIGPVDYKIVRRTKKEMPDEYGQFSSEHETIELVRRFASSIQEADTVLHEVLHGLYHAANLQESDGEERIVSVLATGLIQVFRDNPKLLRWLALKTGSPTE